MKTLRFALPLLVVLAAAAAVEARGFSLVRVRGDLEAAGESDAAGRFYLMASKSGDAASEKLLVVASGLDPDTDYEVLLGEDVDSGVSFGELVQRGDRGYGALKFLSRRDEYPDGVDALADFSGEKVMVVAGGDVVLEGAIPGFVEPGTGAEPPEGSIAFGAGYSTLKPPADSDVDAAGLVTAVAVDSSAGAIERLSVVALGLERNGEYEVRAGDDSLGTVTARGWFGVIRLVLNTARGDTLPDHLGTLAGTAVKVVDSVGATVLEGEIPALE